MCGVPERAVAAAFGAGESAGGRRRAGYPARAGLTLVEIVLAVGLLGTVMTIAGMTFATALRSWRAGSRLADHLHHADFAIEQIVAALRSAYYADTGRAEARYGFVHQSDGLGFHPADSISWVKLGGALIGDDPALAGAPHRVEVFVKPENGFLDDDAYGLGVRSWRIDAQSGDFKPDDVAAVFISPRIVGMKCRMADPGDEYLERGEIEWLDQWEPGMTNRLPRAVEVTLYVEPPRPGDDPLEVRRVVELPMAELSWRPITRRTSARPAARRVAPAGGTRQPRRTTEPGPPSPAR